jgi:hypothetical protein
LPVKHSVSKKRRTPVRTVFSSFPTLVAPLEPLVTQAFRAVFHQSGQEMTPKHVRALVIELGLTRAMRRVQGPEDPLLDRLRMFVRDATEAINEDNQTTRRRR